MIKIDLNRWFKSIDLNQIHPVAMQQHVALRTLRNVLTQRTQRKTCLLNFKSLVIHTPRFTININTLSGALPTKGRFP